VSQQKAPKTVESTHAESRVALVSPNPHEALLAVILRKKKLNTLKQKELQQKRQLLRKQQKTPLPP